MLDSIATKAYGAKCVDRGERWLAKCASWCDLRTFCQIFRTFWAPNFPWLQQAIQRGPSMKMLLTEFASFSHMIIICKLRFCWLLSQTSASSIILRCVYCWLKSDCSVRRSWIRPWMSSWQLWCLSLLVIYSIIKIREVRHECQHDESSLLGWDVHDAERCLLSWFLDEVVDLLERISTLQCQSWHVCSSMWWVKLGVQIAKYPTHFETNVISENDTFSPSWYCTKFQTTLKFVLTIANW